MSCSIANTWEKSFAT